MAQQKSMAAYKSIINQLANKSNVSVADNKNPANSKVSDTTKITADADAKSKADADAKAKAASDKAKADADTKAKADAAAKAKADAAAKAKAGAKAKAKAEAAAKAKIAAAAKAKADAAAKAKLVAAAKAKAEAARIASIKDKAIKAIAFIKKQTYDREKNNAFNETLLKVKDIQNAQNLKGKITLNQSDVNSAYAKISEGAPGYFYYTLHNGVGDKGRLTIVKALYNLYKTKYITLTPDAIENYNNIFK
jgi:membrane protein involved in colicin uptake